ncbi:MAG TPA: tRNA (N(6)-L-threonylcarbamoyladenosine(37)-C(2))-methylthiotransferase MtaB [Clostridiales bacterium]|nr:tRNA (N(6)-L-threonylcarbamoyladenosine(37)-C(2))-methylthiotransferase MtaB [Clostridiales bacterium]
MTKLRAAFHTLGCKTNHYETDALCRQFCQAGFIQVSFDSEADVYLVNTCTVTGEAGRKSRQMLRRARRNNPSAIVVALGCHAELHDVSDCADIAVGTNGKGQVLRQILDLLHRRGLPAPADHFSGQADGTTGATGTAGATSLAAYEELGPADRQSETRAYIKVEDGCNSFCAYCVIPFARGRVRSRSCENIIEEAAALASAGYREVVLTGIHICSYGAEYGLPSHAVMELAQEMAAIPGIERIRLGSLEPLSLTPRFIELARQNPKLLPHFHLSLQSGSDTVLARMNRRYQTREYRGIVGRLRQSFDQPGLTTDVIVGFPGETETEHQASLEFCREIGFTRLHVFRFSSRSGTAAASMPDPVGPQTINRRSQEMLALAGHLAAAFHSRQIGRSQRVLLEKLRPDGYFEGYTPEYVPILLPASPGLSEGQIVSVTGLRSDENFLVCGNANASLS